MNRLARETSPYLLQHRDNPVDWRPWGQDAFDEARRRDIPVFLSIGYSTCHWCHVMAHESFEDQKTADYLNAHFVCVKVDREERPDVDRCYMAFVQATTGGGGWPMSVWLTPEAKPFFGGTYFPPEDRHGRASFRRVLEQIVDVWRSGRERVEEHASRAVEALIPRGTPDASGVDRRALDEAVETFRHVFDAREGGFGGAPKFPRPCALSFLLRQGGDARDMALQTLRAMCHGGICDHLGGGFHRYSVDEYWHVPHFEKMLYDQGQIAVALTEAWQCSHDPVFESAVRATLDYVLRDLTHPLGGFYSAEDADSDGPHGAAEGAYYVWTAEDIGRLLDATAAKAFCAHYGVRPGGNCAPESDPHGELTGKNVLIIRGSSEQTAAALGMSVEAIAASLAESRAILFRERCKRKRPHRDEKILAAWNGLMISGFAVAGAAFAEKDFLAAARRAADFVLREMRMEDGRLLRSWRDGPSGIAGFPEDYACVVRGLIDLYEADFDLRWLREAVALQDLQDDLFGKAAGPRISTGDPLVPVMPADDHDGAEPAADSVRAENLTRLGRLMREPAREAMVTDVFAAHGHTLNRHPSAMPCLLSALDLATKVPEYAVVSAADPSSAGMLLGQWRSTFQPHASTILLASAESREFFAQRAPETRGMMPPPAGALLYFCRDGACAAPVASWPPA